MKTDDILAVIPTLEWKTNDKGCWLVTSHNPNADGYCAVKLDGKTQLIHKMAWAIRHGYKVMPKGLQAHHICFERSCCNPEHLAGMDQESHITYHNNSRKFSLGEWQKKTARPALSKWFDFDKSGDQLKYPCEAFPLPIGDRCQVGRKKDKLTYYGPTGRQIKAPQDEWETIFEKIPGWTEFTLDKGVVSIISDIEREICMDIKDLELCQKEKQCDLLLIGDDGKHFTMRRWQYGVTTIKSCMGNTHLSCKTEDGKMFYIKVEQVDRSWKGKRAKYKFNEINKAGSPKNAQLISIEE